ncbi:hypothetical protein BDP27DRAFT_1370158 [Rhodocollybia butyracea]|uniref:Uncharacterized protein n=1 Tax=Rhodocollybia butyracea TaxID=206335 RepID=A0A9P5PBL0_9AGAR|nr:hypothetical protein BDP27DRAFT_1370158 [Rhodocollybia butyracea]
MEASLDKSFGLDTYMIPQVLASHSKRYISKMEFNKVNEPASSVVEKRGMKNLLRVMLCKDSFRYIAILYPHLAPNKITIFHQDLAEPHTDIQATWSSKLKYLVRWQLGVHKDGVCFCRPGDRRWMQLWWKWVDRQGCWSTGKMSFVKSGRSGWKGLVVSMSRFSRFPSSRVSSETIAGSALPTFSLALCLTFRHYPSHVDNVICIPKAESSIVGDKRTVGEKENDPYADIPAMLQISTFLHVPPTPLLDTTFLALRLSKRLLHATFFEYPI